MKLFVLAIWCPAVLSQMIPDPCGSFNTCAKGPSDNPECNCDPSCYSYGDCCSDLPLDPETPSPSGLSPDMFQCGDEDFYRIIKCPAGTSEESRQLCEIDHPHDPYGILLVTDIQTGLVYRSIYCSRCHGVPDTNLAIWRFLVYCPEIDRSRWSHNQSSLSDILYFSKQHQAWGVKDTIKGFKQCYINLESPSATTYPVLPKPRYCRGGFTSDCPDSWNDPEIRKRCQTYFSPLSVNKDRPRLRLYKNFFCAICHRDAQDYHKMCMVSSPERRFGGYRGCRGGTTQLTVPPLCVLFDMNTSNGPEVGRSFSCPEGEVVFSGTCKELSCALPGWKMADGICVLET